MPLLFGMDVAYLIVISWKNSNNVHRGIYQTIQASRDSSLCACSMLQDFYHLFFICKNKFHVLDFYGYFTMVKRVWPHLLLWVESDTVLFTKLKKKMYFFWWSDVYSRKYKIMYCVYLHLFAINETNHKLFELVSKPFVYYVCCKICHLNPIYIIQFTGEGWKD